MLALLDHFEVALSGRRAVVVVGRSAVVGALSPVPGGVGPVTTALLLRHVVSAASPSLS